MADLTVDPERDRKLYELDVQAGEGEPSAEPFTPCGLDYFRSRVLNDPNLIPDGYFVAVDHSSYGSVGEYVGVSNLFRAQGSTDMIDTGFTGVIPSHRRLGIALALKLRAVRWCQERGYRVLKTDNHSLNRPMLSINERLGFVKQPAWITYVKRLGDEE